MWDQRYNTDEYVYGTWPNDFLNSNWQHLPVGRVLSIGEGEGRNAVFLAQQGFDVHAVDSSAIGLQKASRLASERGVNITTHHSDLEHFQVEPHSFDAAIAIFCHLPVHLRQTVHQKLIEGLRPGGVVLLEAYTPEQLNHQTGGPSKEEMLYSLEQLQKDFAGLEFLHQKELLREICEGRLHQGQGAVVQLIALKH